MVAPNVVSIRSDSDIIAACMAARDVARRMGFNAVDQARIATATSELARNIVIYAGEGSVTINQVERGQRTGIELVFEKQGPDLANLPQALAGEAPPIQIGIGPPGSRRLMDDIQIETAVDIGTRITCYKWLR